MYLDLVEEGYDDIKFVGVNGYAYINNDYNCMICDSPDECSNCTEERILPWVQDVPAIIIEEYENQIDCEQNELSWGVGEQISWSLLGESECIENGYSWFHGECIEFIYGCLQDVDIWGNWDITLRDLVIVNKQGYEVSRLNLTGNNPDPNSTCGENYQTIKDLIIGAR